MKKINLLLTFLLVFFTSVSMISAEEKLVCDKTVEVGKTVTCTFTVDEETRMIETDPEYFKIESVSGNGNTQRNDYQAIFQSSGKIKFIAKKSGNVHVYVSSADGIFGYEELEQIVKVTEKTTTTTTTTTTKPKSDNNYLSSITIDGKEIENFSKNTTKYFVDVDNSVKKVTIKAKQEDEIAEVTIDGPNNLAIGDNEYIISVTSENESTKYYKIIITRADEEESSSTEIKSIKIKGYNLNFDKTSKTFHLNIKPEDTELDITIKLKDENASYEIEDNDNLQDGSVIKIIVTAEDETTDTYRIIISKKSSSILPIIIGSVSALLIIIVIILIVINNKKKKNKKDNIKNTDSNQPKIQKENNNEVKKDSIIEEKTIEMPAISTPDESTELSSLDEEDNIPYDNDEEDETRILSYAEQKELERVNKELIEEENEKTSKEIDKALEKILDFEYENDEEDE